jgi:hypothetical protein
VAVDGGCFPDSSGTLDSAFTPEQGSPHNCNFRVAWRGCAVDETLENAAKRACLKKLAGLKKCLIFVYFEQLAAFGRHIRDPRVPERSQAYLAFDSPAAGTDAPGRPVETSQTGLVRSASF